MSHQYYHQIHVNWKSRLANDVKTFIEDLVLTEEDQIEVTLLSLKKLGVDDKINKFLRKPSAKGRKLTPTTTRSAIWEFWHANSLYNNITSCPLASDWKEQNTSLTRLHRYCNNNFKKKSEFLSEPLGYYEQHCEGPVQKIHHRKSNIGSILWNILRAKAICSCKVGDYNGWYQQNCLLTVTNRYN